MKSNEKMPADTIKIIRHKVFKSNMLDNRNSNGASAIYSNHMTSYSNSYNLVEYEYQEEIDSIVEPQKPKVDTSNKHIRIVPIMNSDGEFSYIYINSNQDTLLVDKVESVKEDNIYDSLTEPPMKNEFYASDTIQPTDYNFGNMQSVSIYYPPKSHYENTPKQSLNDQAAEGAYFSVMLLITIAYIHRCLVNGSWSKFGSELKSAWVG